LASTELCETFSFGKTHGAGLHTNGGNAPASPEPFPCNCTLPARTALDISTPVEIGDFSKGDCLPWALANPAIATSNNATSDTTINLGVFKGVLQFFRR
jgi:hypothetical protein